MTINQLAHIEQLEANLWDAADNLRANSKLTAGEYCMPVLGVIFLRHATNRYAEALREIQAEQATGKIPKRPLTAADFKKRRALLLPKEAHYDELLKLPKGSDLGTALVEAMNAIERDFEPLQGQLPKDYTKFENTLLEDLLRVFDSETLRSTSGDIFGRINEYFLMKFAMQGAQDNGEFFTPPSLVQTIVNVIEPDHGTVFDPACGSGGMFVQSSHFIERRGESAAHRVTFYGQEYKTSNLRLAKMNLAVHALEGNIVEANTFYEDPHRLPEGKPLWGNCDFLMANPPFNVDKVDAEKAKVDRRLPFGLPGVNKDKKVSNGNYLWISYFWSYLNKTGRAGFVMSSQASSAGHGEMDVRRKLVETGGVDVMISIRSNFFYTRTVPCELWHFDRGKPVDRRDQVLMIDARNIYRKVTRKIYDFSPEQLQNLTAIVWLYRGQSDRFIALVQHYLERTLTEAAAIVGKSADYRTAYGALTNAVAPFIKTVPKDSPIRELVKERDDAAKNCFQGLEYLTKRIAKDWKKPGEPKLAAQKKLLGELEDLATACRDLVKDVDLAFKLDTRLVDMAEKDFNAKEHEAWDGRAIGRLEKELDARRKEAVEQLKAAAYFERQAHWLLSRFPDAKLVAVPGLVKLVDRKDIKAADWSLTPGRYVGVAPPEVDENFDFEQALADIHIELTDLTQEAAVLAKKIQRNFEELA
ncbi:HsdM family class I SAM-dependent methyltransferase [Candidatus Nitrospira nitrificans]|uniref:site-specific DNA-methyltransferase (adenine-specific) n=1 Tax=Candidatus Nitrospira nitrificans TaxID=1742973 RepID=A0A0S4L1R5_9BACT|nr:class I SAM-dependent DNA methyltransferase [Candidatus Nitrospira nitrificans]CUS31628.1 Type I restriction-modification system methyltransferase subunit [Candidatus Nitrospira nitrificans]